MISLLSNDQLTSIVNVKVTVLSPSMAEPRTADLATDMMMMVVWSLMIPDDWSQDCPGHH